MRFGEGPLCFDGLLYCKGMLDSEMELNCSYLGLLGYVRIRECFVEVSEHPCPEAASAFFERR